MYEAGIREITVAYPEGVQEGVPAAEFKTKVVGQFPPPQKGGPLSRCQIPTNSVIRGVYSILQSADPKLDSQHETCKSDAQVQLKKDRPYECEHVLNRLFHQSQEQDGKRWVNEPETCDNSFKLNKTERLVYGANRRFKEQLNATRKDKQKYEFLWCVNWNSSLLQKDEEFCVEHRSVDYHSIFAGHR